MRGKKRAGRIRNRLFAGLFCISLLFADMSSAAPAWAREAETAAVEAAVNTGQEPEVKDEERNAQDAGRADVSKDAPAKTDAESGDAADGAQNPGSGDHVGGAQDSGDEDTAGGVQGPGEEDAAGGAQEPEEEDTAGGAQEPGKEDTAGDAQNPGGEDAGEEDTGPEAGEDSDGREDTEEKDSISENDTVQESVSENDVSADDASVTSLLAAGDNIANGQYGNVTWVIDANGKLTVEGTGEFKGRGSTAPWYGWRTQIKSAEIKLTDTTDASGMFKGCSALADVNLKKFDTSKVTTMRGMFEGCSKLSDIDLSGMDTGSVTDMGWVFRDCSALKNLDLSGFDTGRVTDMSYMFYGCWQMGTLDLAGFDTAAVTTMENMFYGCRGLKSLNLTSFNTGNVQNMAGMFNGCSGLGSLDLSHFKTEQVNTMSRMFLNCYGLKSLNVGNFDTGNVTDMFMMFDGCNGLTNLDVTHFNTAKVTNMADMFNGCSRLTSLDVTHFDTGNVTSMSGMFSACAGMDTIDLSGFNTSKVTNMSNMFYGGAVVGAAGYGEGFKHLDLSHFDTAQVTNMANMFNRQYNLVDLNVSGFDTSRVTIMRSMFSYCKNLPQLELGSFDTANVTDMVDMFYDCWALKSLDLSHFNLEKHKTGVSNELQLFAGCRALTTLYTPCNLKEPLTCMLPSENSADVTTIHWYDMAGTEYRELPRLSYSILLQRDKKPDVAQIGITAKKTVTNYNCGDVIKIDDLTVTYCGTDGKIIKLAQSEYTTNASDIDMSTPGEKTLVVTYTPSGGKPLTAQIKLRVTLLLTAENVKITLPQESYAYTAAGQKPVPTVTLVKAGADAGALEAESDYKVSYRNNVHAGAAEVAVTGQGIYSGSVTKEFQITPASLTIIAKDMTVGVEDVLAAEDYPYEDTLLGTDALVKKPAFTFTWNGADDGQDAQAQADGGLIDTSRIGSYTVTPKEAEAGKDYGEITYVPGTLTVAEERVVYTVNFDLMGHGKDFVKSGIKAGSLLELEKEQYAPKAEGYVFAGWYRDKSFAAKSAWDFAADTVQGDMTLYACWLTDGSGSATTTGGLKLFVQEIPDLSYTGSALKPAVTVYDSDGTTLLKAGKDYTVKYANNTNAVKVGTDGAPVQAGGTAKVTSPGKTEEKITNVIGTFTKECPYVMITGKGNYAETIYQNFCILPADIAADDGETDAQGNTSLAAGFTLKYTDQFEAKANKYAGVISSFKYKKALKANTDYTYGVQDAEGKAVTLNVKGQLPLNEGVYSLTVTGIGNYTGNVTRKLYVAQKRELIKNVAVSLGKNQKSRPYTGKDVTLTPGYYDTKTKKNYKVQADGKVSSEAEPNANDLFLVKAGQESLIWNTDYTVRYSNNRAVGTATMTITGIGAYYGTKSVTFKVTGKAFTAKTIEVAAAVNESDAKDNGFKKNMPYTGRAVTQNKVTLSTKATAKEPQAETLKYGEHYTISYKNNIKKGTATMTFTARPESGYSGKFNKTFKIGQQYLAESMFYKVDVDGSAVKRNVEVTGRDERKHSVTLKWDEDAVHSKGGASLSFVLKNEKGDTLRQGTDYTVSYQNHKAATKQSAGSKQPVMTIKGKGNYAGTLAVQFQIVPASITSESLTVAASQVQKKNNMKLKDFKLKVTDGKTVLKAGMDYTVDESGCTPEIIQAYAEALEAGTAASAKTPKAVLRGIAGYGAKTAEGQETVREISLAGYIYTTKLTAKNLKVEVVGDRTYTGQNVEPQIKVSYYKDNNAAKQDASGEELTAGKDYTVTYGSKNMAAGKNKGSVTVTGAGLYGGSVTVKFTIEKKAIY